MIGRYMAMPAIAESRIIRWDEKEVEFWYENSETGKIEKLTFGLTATPRGSARIARVNRLCEDKEFGFVVDYVGLLGELDKALTMYSAFEGFDDEDIAGTLTSVSAEVEKLPQRYSDLWDLFKEVKNSYDEEAYEVLLADAALREDFYQRLAEYALLDTHIQANEVIQLNKPVNIFDDRMFNHLKEEQGVLQRQITAAKADTIAHATKRAITEKIEEAPAFYEKFSKLIQQAIEDFRAKRLSDLEY